MVACQLVGIIPKVKGSGNNLVIDLFISKQALKSSREAQKIEKWSEKVKLWLKGQFSLESTLSFGESRYGSQMHNAQLTDSDLPIWLAAQRAIPLYEGVLSSVGPRGRLIRKLLTRIGLLPPMSEASVILDSDSKHSETYLG